MVGIDYVIVRSSPRRQRLGDRAAGTIVVRERGPEEEEALTPVPGTDAQAPAAAQPLDRAAPTAAELFGDAAGVLGRQPGAGSAPGPSAPGAREATSGEREAEPPGLEAMPPEPEPEATPRRQSWTAAGFPYADWDLRQTLLGLIAGLVLGGVVAPVLVVPFDPDLDSTGALLAAQGLLAVALMAVSIGVAGGRARDLMVRPAPQPPGRRELTLLGIRPVRPTAFGWMALAMVSYYVIAAVYTALIGAPEQEDIARDLGLDAGLLAAIPVVILIVGVAPLAEEVFFRGMFFAGLRRRLATVPAALISAAVFGGLHATTGISAVPVLIAFGFVLALLYERTGSLVPGMTAHAINNALALAVAS
jgi:membrane protease YdiL (CAAX protease family)